VLRQGAFARYITGDAISMLGTWMQQMAQGWVLAGLTTTAFTLGLVTFFSSLPMLALTMFGGVIADRFDKRRILFVAQIVQALLAVWIGRLVAMGEIRVLHIVVAGVCLGITTAFEMPAASALVPELVRREQLSAAIAVDRSIFHATRLIGPALGGWLIGLLGTAWAFYANALSFSALMIALMTIHPRPLGTAHEEAARRTGMADGLAYVRRDKPTRAMISLLAMATFCISPFFMILMPIYSRHVLHIPAEQHGILMGSSGIGAFAGSLWLLSIRQDKRRGWLIAAVGGIVIAMMGVAAARGLTEAAVAMITLTLGTSTVFGLANTIVQERAPDYIRGRVSAIAGLSFFGVLPFSGLIMSKFADLVGLRVAMGSSALCFGLGAAVMLYAHRRAEEQPPVDDEAEVEKGARQPEAL
jgi:MFS family permease